MRGMIQQLMACGKKCHFIFCNNRRVVKKTILQLKLELDYPEKLKISSLPQDNKNDNKKVFEDLRDLVQQNKKYHTFVDEFELGSFYDEGGESALEEVKKLVPSFWIIVAGVQGAEETDFTSENFRKIFGSTFYIPVMKYPLRCIFNSRILKEDHFTNEIF